LQHSYVTKGLPREILRSLDLSVSVGEVVVVTGASGAGKTTLLTLCGALRSIQSGYVEVVSKQLAGLSAEEQREVRASIGFIFQSHNLIEALTAGQNVMMSLLGRLETSQAIEQTEAILGSLGLGDRVDAFPEELSGGEKQRVAVARALVRRPSVILADEPTASLDDVSARTVKESIRRATTELGGATLLVTHDQRVFDIADRILHLDAGLLTDRTLVAMSGTSMRVAESA
jgi:putative ABC transport system ATP-binding protein